MGGFRASLACWSVTLQIIKFEERISPIAAPKAGGVRIRSSMPEAFRSDGPCGNGSRLGAEFFALKESMR